MQLVRVPGDGRCLFRALALGRHWAKTGNLDALNANDVRWAREADALRGDICDELLNRKEDLEAYVEGDFAEYVQAMRAPSTWGGELGEAQ
ncbi:hypothetical protein QBZ16_004731 [Prototheca wickerhamii]|uniref:OTU domain-containing protein n=1 Tax=Prototheca wickerhamii TaxID=3111 RepID=A0AAD9IJ93_PROWI|nr:hypothetical protein QBZ16_004731 [Prototheca wickerhamii]